MSEERKEYAYKGTVTIGTDEYRDLIEGIVTAIAEKDAIDSKYWNKYREADTLKKELDAAVAELADYKAFFAEDDSVKTKFKLWKIERQEAAE